jgi:outer membrane phospholipase A
MRHSTASLCLIGSILLGGALAAGEAFASATPSFVLVPPSDAVVGSSSFTVTLYVNNETDAVVTFQAPRELTALVETRTASQRTVLKASSPDLTGTIRLRPQEFRRIEYRGSLPSLENGVVTMELLDHQANRVMFASVAEEADTAPVVAPLLDTVPPGDHEPPSSDGTLTDSIVSGLSTHEPVYFIVGGGGDDVTAKFQLSAQYQIFRAMPGDRDRPGLLGHVARFLDGIHASYTQTSVWDLSSPSAPFLDTSFRPSLYYFNDDLIEPISILGQLGLQVGLEHESNGKSGADSRSINIFFARPIFTFGDVNEYHWTVAPKLYAYLEKSDNQDIDHYRGYLDLLIKFGKTDGLELAATLRKGTRSSFGSAQVDATYPIARLLPHLGAFLHLQYFYGYGETLLDYNRNAGSQIRAGLMLVPYGKLFP